MEQQLHQLRQYCTVMIGGFQTGKFELAWAAARNAEALLDDLRRHDTVLDVPRVGGRELRDLR